MQCPDRCMGVPGGRGPMACEALGQLRRVVRQMLQRHGTILDEGNWLAVAFHRHDDVEPGLSDVPDLRLLGGLDRLQNRTGKAEIGHHLIQALQVGKDRALLVAGEFHQEDRVGLAADEPVDQGAVGGDVAAELDDAAIHQLDGRRFERHQVLGRGHGLMKGRKMTNAEHAMRRQPRELQLEALEEGKRPLRAHQQGRHVVARWINAIEIVPPDPPLHPRISRGDLVDIVRGDLSDRLNQVSISIATIDARKVTGHVTEAAVPPRGEEGVDLEDVIDHDAVADRARPAGIVAGHAAKRSAGACRDVDRVEQAVRLEMPVQLIEHDARLDPDGLVVGLEIADAVQMAGAVEHQALADGLPRLRGAAAARQKRDALCARDRKCGFEIRFRLRADDADRLDLVDRRIRAVAPAIEFFEQDIAGKLLPELGRKPRIARLHAMSLHQQAILPHQRSKLGRITWALARAVQVHDVATPPALHWQSGDSGAYMDGDFFVSGASVHVRSFQKRPPFFADSGADQCAGPDSSRDGPSDHRPSRPDIRQPGGRGARRAEAGLRYGGAGGHLSRLGTGAWEAALVNTLSPGDRVLMAETGQFSTLWVELARRLGLDVQLLQGNWRRGADPEAIEVALKEDEEGVIKAVAVVHNETSTGVTSRIPDVRKAIDSAGHGALFMVDTISSLASIDYRHDEWGVDVTVAGSQKGLMLPPGLSFNAVSEKALAAAKSSTTPKSYWDWSAMLSANAQSVFPYTPATNLLYGLKEALAMLEEEGLAQVFARHQRHARATRAAVEAWGLEVLAEDPREYSGSLTAVLLPDGQDADALRALILGPLRPLARQRARQA